MYINNYITLRIFFAEYFKNPICRVSISKLHILSPAEVIIQVALIILSAGGSSFFVRE